MTEPSNPPSVQTPPEGAPAGTENKAPESTPPWGDDANFDAKRAWERIQQQAKDIDKLRTREVLTDDQRTKLAEYDKAIEAQKSDLQKAQDAASRAEQRAADLLATAVKAKVEALAAATFADPSDASALLDVSKFAKDGDIDTDGIAEALKGLLASKPHLAKSTDSRTPAPNPAQGASGSGSGSGATQLTRADLARMSPEQIDKAHTEGRLADLLAGKQ